ncbi:hypothetical protein F511_12326 [Dorcoceras hygrometricum]|uniref:Uncharacterized protein n=1 Tax=Dorcoceras hygrometricum TaxID=472368 RepID=A0A2Z7BPB8_9LAMI|nr:hypothetical protein F511_12326 [Dorcoceras hygrometricum]
MHLLFECTDVSWKYNKKSIEEDCHEAEFVQSKQRVYTVVASYSDSVASYSERKLLLEVNESAVAMKVNQLLHVKEDKTAAGIIYLWEQTAAGTLYLLFLSELIYCEAPI